MAKAKEAVTLYRVRTGVQKDGFAAHTPDDEPSSLSEFDAAWLAWALANGVIEVWDPAAEAVAPPAEGPLYLEHFHGDPAAAPEGTWEYKWRVEREAQGKTAKAPPKAAGDKE